MRVISTASDLAATVTRLIRKCRRIRWAVAWASDGFPACALLKQHSDKINQLTIGTHFYQTHPDFISALRDHESVRFVLETDGIFHPKLYLFEHGDGHWDCIVGSPNFTRAAFSSNAEFAVHFSSQDAGSEQLYAGIDVALSNFFKSAERFDELRLARYRLLWARQQDRLESLSGKYGSERTKRRAVDTPLMATAWPDYFARVKDDVLHSVGHRLWMLNEARRWFAERRFGGFDLDSRRKVAGLDKRWGYFGGMSGLGHFQHAINQNNPRISDALDEIPLDGEVSHEQFRRFASIYATAFPSARTGTASRLLAMKRPDRFVCLAKKNLRGLSREFCIPKSIGLSEYWTKAIQRLTDSEWWDSPEPSEDFELQIWRCRAAFLDVWFFEPSQSDLEQSKASAR